MADFTIEAKRVKSGQNLTSMENSAIQAISTLKQIKIGIATLKTEVQNDADYTAEDATAVQTVIDSLLAGIATI